jgi:hypothetical protein
MLGVEAVAERVADHVIGHHPTMPGVGETAQAVAATHRLKDILHASMITTVPYSVQDDKRGEFSGDNAIRAVRQAPAKYGSRLGGA